ncbi:MAG: FAD-dependent oxidoreductase [Rhodospirillales bacterium]|nr:FAD-dependent oxidoreductase [Rhodospirillales bacterium]
MSHVHVIGAGLAGLSAALALTEAPGCTLTLHEAGPAAGGRCRSYHDRALDLRIDNGNHLLLSGNHAAAAYLATIGASDRLHGPDTPVFPFFDRRSGARWAVRMNQGRLPWWLLSPGRRVPDTRLSEYAALIGFARVRDDTPVADMMRHGRLYERLVEPLAVAALNTRPETGLARLLGAVIRETMMQGGAACLPRYPIGGLSDALVDPALDLLRRRGAEIRFSHRIAALEITDGRVTALRGPDGTLPLGSDDAVVLAVPPWVATGLLPGLTAPDAFEAIVNLHFRHLADAAGDPAGALREAGLVGVVSGTAEWILRKSDHVSVTISAANQRLDQPADQLAAEVWGDIAAALGTAAPLPAWRVVKEKRATFAATAAQEARRPGARSPLANLVLAGDWTATGLPATIEGAIRSGRTAATLLRAG